MTQLAFVPKPGQVDYTFIRYAPTVNIVVMRRSKIFCVQRAATMTVYPNYWDWVCGYLDDNQSIEEKAYEELHEELGIGRDDIESLTRGEPWIDEAPEYNKTWLIVPVLAKVKTATFKLDWEAQNSGWFTWNELQKLDMVPGSLRTAEQFLRH